MKTSSQRIWIGRSGWLKPAIVAIRMKPEHRHVRRNQEDQALLDVGHEAAPFAQAMHEGHERVVAQDQVRGLAGNGGPAPHRHGDVGVVERRGVVHAVARHRHGPAGAPGNVHDPELLLRDGPRHDVQGGQLRGQAVIVPLGQLRAR